MSPHNLETIVIGLAIVALVTYRLSQWQSVRPSRLFRMPLILAALGLLSLAGSGRQLTRWHPGVPDLAIVTSELAIGIMVGWLIGRLTVIRTFADGTRSKLLPGGIAVWLVFVALRIGFGIAASMMGASVAALPGITLIVIAVIKAVQGLMVHVRVIRHLAKEQPTYADTLR